MKIRLDQLLVDRGLAETKSKAQALIAVGKVLIGKKICDKAGHQVAFDCEPVIMEPEHPYVSRGGMKLAHAITHFSLSAQGAVCVDVGASTGGFADVLLRAGARKIYAVDVGHGQFDWKLRQDARVVVLEKTNARYLDAALIPEQPDWIVCDASFISLKTVLPAAMSLTSPEATLVALIKPQFEVGRERVGKGGVVREPELHKEVCEEIANWISGLGGWQVLGITESPVRGPKGNIEFLICARKQSQVV